MRAAGSGQLQKAIDYSEKALELAEKTKDTNTRLGATLGLSSTYTFARKFDKARQLIQRGFAIVEEFDPNTDARVNWESVLYLYHGNDLMRLREYEKASEAFFNSVSAAEQRIRIADRLRNPQNIESARINLVHTVVRLADSYSQVRKFREAMEHYERAVNIIKEWGLKYPHQAALAWGLGELHRQQGKFPQALEKFNEALALAKNTYAINAANMSIGRVLLQTGKPAEAIAFIQSTIGQIESTRSVLVSEDIRQSYFEGHLGTYLVLMRSYLAVGKPGEAFNYSERARSRVFLDVLGSRVQLAKEKSGLLAEERTLQERIASIKARLAGGQTETDTLRRELLQTENSYSAFLSKVRKENKEQASLMSVEPLTLKQVQELIDPGQTLIEYFVTDSEVFVWVVEKDKLNFQRVALSKNELAKQVKSLREMISNPGDARELNEASASLYNSLIHPLLPHIKGKELIIVPHDVLHYLPFQALLGADGRYLIEKYPISYLSSASLLQFTKEKRRAMGEKVLAFGNPDLNDPKMSLQFAGIEAKEIKSLYPNSVVYLGKEATEEKAKTLSPVNDIIHFASHAELNENDPLSSAVLLAKSGKEDGRLEVREIFGMELKASLVVLSACETGLGKLSTGDELVGLTRAFIYAGTPSVVASLWKVEDSSTAQLMASFYRNLKTMTKVEALRQAQLNLIRGNVNSDLLARRGIGGVGKLGETPAAKTPAQESVSTPNAISTSHPYFWAPFILVGDGK